MRRIIEYFWPGFYTLIFFLKKSIFMALFFPTNKHTFCCNVCFMNSFQTVAAAGVNFGGLENCFPVEKNVDLCK